MKVIGSNEYDLVLAVVGSRSFDDLRRLRDETDAYIGELLWDHPLPPNMWNVCIVSGGAKGADSLAVTYAQLRGYDTIAYLADWKQYGKKAGFLRNATIVNTVEAGIAFWDGKSKGTRDTIKKLDDSKKPYRIVYNDGIQQQDVLFRV